MSLEDFTPEQFYWSCEGLQVLELGLERFVGAAKTPRGSTEPSTPAHEMPDAKKDEKSAE